LSEVWNNLGAAQSRKNLPEAAESFRKASEGDPNDSSYLFNLGYVLWKNGEFEAAAQKFRASLDLAPEDALAILMLGRSLKGTPVRETEQRIKGLERMRANFEELAYRQLRVTWSGK
jgi:tetratricopeptide (TPR) repeat protein